MAKAVRQRRINRQMDHQLNSPYDILEHLNYQHVPHTRYDPIPGTDDNPQGPPIESQVNQPALPPPGTYEYHPRPSQTFGSGPNTLEQMDQDQYAKYRTANPYYPFTDREEWALAKWMNRTLNKTQTDEFLKLEWVSMLFRRCVFYC